MDVRFTAVHEAAKLPTRGSEGAAGLDLYAIEEVAIPSGCWCLIRTGLNIELPPGHEGQVRPRSGLALRNGVTVLNSPGTIDADYRGEVMVNLINHGQVSYFVKPGDRIAQLVIAPVVYAVPAWAASLSATPRGRAGWGSTGR